MRTGQIGKSLYPDRLPGPTVLSACCIPGVLPRLTEVHVHVQIAQKVILLLAVFAYVPDSENLDILVPD